MRRPVPNFVPVPAAHHVNEPGARPKRGAKLSCGHVVEGGPTTSGVRERWWCPECRQFRSKSKVVWS